MITPAERVLVEALRRSSSISIRFGDCEVRVRNGEFSHDVAIALQSHLNRVHETREYRKPEILARNAGHIDKCKKSSKISIE